MKAHAQKTPLQRPTVPYSAHSTLRTPHATVHSTVYVSNGRERRETAIGKTTQVILRNFHEQHAWMLLPAQKAAMAIRFETAQDTTPDLPEGALLERTVLGKQTAEGIPCTQMRVKAFYQNTLRFEGVLCETEEHIVLSLEGTGYAQNKPTQVSLALSQLSKGPQPSALFEVPKDFKLIQTPQSKVFKNP